jgi:hypothetical protein
MGSRALLSGAAFTALCIVACAGGDGGASKTLPKTTPEGLELRENTALRAVYLRPGARLDQYDKVKLLDCYVAFYKNWQRDYNDRVDFQSHVGKHDMERIKKRVAHDFSEVFTKQLLSDGHNIVDSTGDDVLIVKPAIINLVVTAPDTMSSDMSRTYVASAGQMTLYMELYDSVTDSLLARVIDPQADSDVGGISMSNAVSNKAAEERIMRRWAKLLSNHLAHVKE